MLLLDNYRTMGQCQAAVAEAVVRFGGIDILLCCSSEGGFCFSSLSHCLYCIHPP